MRGWKNVWVLWLCVGVATFVVGFGVGKVEGPKYRFYPVREASMMPTIPPKSAVIVQAGDFRPGDVVAYETSDGLVTHRIVARNPDGTLQTKGDANQAPDPCLVAPSQVVGRVVAAAPMLGYWLVYLSSPLGACAAAAFLVVLFVLGTLMHDLLDQPVRPPGSSVSAVRCIEPSR